MASKPTLSSLAQLAESASTNRLCPVRLDVCSCQQNEGTAEEMLQTLFGNLKRVHAVVVNPEKCLASTIRGEQVRENEVAVWV